MLTIVVVVVVVVVVVNQYWFRLGVSPVADDQSLDRHSHLLINL